MKGIRWKKPGMKKREGQRIDGEGVLEMKEQIMEKFEKEKNKGKSYKGKSHKGK